MTALSSTRSLGRIYALEAKYEFLKLLRLPMYVLPAATIPFVVPSRVSIVDAAGGDPRQLRSGGIDVASIHSSPAANAPVLMENAAGRPWRGRLRAVLINLSNFTQYAE